MDNLLARDNDPNLVTFRIGSSPPPHWRLEALPTVPPDVNDDAVTVLAFVRTGNSMLSTHDQLPLTTPAVVAVAAAWRRHDILPRHILTTASATTFPAIATERRE